MGMMLFATLKGAGLGLWSLAPLWIPGLLDVASEGADKEDTVDGWKELPAIATVAGISGMDGSDSRREEEGAGDGAVAKPGWWEA